MFILQVNVSKPKSKSGHRYVKATCVRETSQHKVYNLWLLLESAGTVVSGHCTCTADDQGCKHFAALLFALSSYTDRHRDRHTQVGTDTTCIWDKPRKESQPMEVDDIDIRIKHKDQPLFEASTNFYSPMKVTQENLKLIEKRLKQTAEQGSLAYQYLSDSDDDISNMSESDRLPPSIHDCVACSNPSDFAQYLAKVYTEDVVENIEELSRGQGDTDVWLRSRAGRITSSLAHNVKHCRAPSPKSYIVDSILGKGFKGNKHTEYGNQMETVGRNLFKVKYGDKHKKFKVLEKGLIVRPDLPHLGASPDGIVECSCCESALLEIKCPSSLRNSGIKELCQHKNHRSNIQYDDADGLHIVDNGPWDSQIQFAMGITKLHKCYLVVYTSVAPYIHVTEVHFKPDEWVKTVETATSFYKTCVIPRLFSGK